MNYMHHQRCEVDRRSVRVRLTEKGRSLRDLVSDLFRRHAETLEQRGVMGREGMLEVGEALRRMERFWSDQIRYIY